MIMSNMSKRMSGKKIMGESHERGLISRCLNGFGEGIEAVGAVKAFLILTAAVFGLAVAPGGYRGA